MPALVDLLERDLRPLVEQCDGQRPIVVGLCGAQGCGKSTVAAGLAARIAGTAVLSLDDLYLPRQARVALGRRVHPLLATRGVPGTHDISLGLDVMAALDQGADAQLPRFDKASDDRAPPAAWPVAPGGTPLLILEGWCIGACPQPAAALAKPVNALERDEDPDGIWRRCVNDALVGQYQTLFARIDHLVLLAAPDVATVERWRCEQESVLRKQAPTGVGVMTDAEISRFVAHYERLTRHILAEMPDRADLVVRLDHDRAPGRVTRR
ncbi:kinase [Sphingomonas sp. AR_OL41]|uniref:kinase n=1 Tax=Sphingomonas sp. AR_OL41 TaxID=3042729 RepID=UPI00247FC5D0|nr:kinase [Sphingomonas sp. AR_OL41]MDH7973912.1 kinase [Sphingomonas sp. AR_OL41]